MFEDTTTGKVVRFYGTYTEAKRRAVHELQSKYAQVRVMP